MTTMTLHIFNPEHDIALASGLENFTAPHAGRQLRHDLGWIPALWTEEGDTILVEDVEAAERSLHRLQGKLQTRCRPQFVSSPDSNQTTKVAPWGWNGALRSQLLRLGLREEILPTKEMVGTIRELSHRRTAAALLHTLSSLKGYTGDVRVCLNEEEVKDCRERWGRIVVKAPWSSSGRGVRFVDGLMTDSLRGWLRNMLERQGAVTVEPYYNKVKDFAMEFESDGKGLITYLGLSLFHTQNGAYTGNLLATEKYKRGFLAQYLSPELLDDTQQAICQQLAPVIGTVYEGPFGIDMMVVAGGQDSGFLLHPCVEINLRRTMGHVALALTRRLNPQDDEGILQVMRVLYEDNQYKLKIQRP